MEYTFEFKEPCLFKGVCVKAPTNCNSMCTTYREFHYLMNTSNIPNRFKESVKLYPIEEDLKAFQTLNDIKNDIENFVKDGRFLCLWSSKTGNGKSTFICKIMKTYLAVSADGNGLKDLAWFAYVPSLLSMCKDFKNDEREEHIKACKERPLVVLDDIGSADLSKYDTSVISDIIDTRYSQNRATIFTSNLSESGLEASVGVRMADRILSDICIKFVGGSNRSSTDTYVRR